VIDLWPAAVAPRIRLVLHPVARAALGLPVEMSLSAGPAPEPIALPVPRVKPS
jgi:hypothetical protein